MGDRRNSPNTRISELLQFFIKQTGRLNDWLVIWILHQPDIKALFYQHRAPVTLAELNFCIVNCYSKASRNNFDLSDVGHPLDTAVGFWEITRDLPEKSFLKARACHSGRLSILTQRTCQPKISFPVSAAAVRVICMACFCIRARVASLTPF